MEWTKEKVRAYYQKHFNSSPVELSDLEYEILEEHHFACANCAAPLNQLDDFPVINEEDWDVLCEDCDHELNYESCELCEESFPNPTLEGGHYFVVPPGWGEETGLKVGLYQVTSYPFYQSSVFGVERIFKEAVEWKADFPSTINSADLHVNNICPACFISLPKKI